MASESGLEGDDSDWESEAADHTYLARASEPITPSQPSTSLPPWASRHTKDLRHITPFSNAHYMAAVEVNGACVNALFDSGGARSMVDVEAAKQMGLEVQRARRGKSYGSFFGPGNKEI